MIRVVIPFKDLVKGMGGADADRLALFKKCESRLLGGIPIETNNTGIYVQYKCEYNGKNGYIKFEFNEEGLHVEYWCENDNGEEVCNEINKTYREFVSEIIFD